MKKLLFTYLLILIAANVWAQGFDCTFTHYSTEEGLPQKTVMNILQDKDGMMWFSTWDGLSKFDGYTFTNYRADKDNLIDLVNNRIDFFYEDIYGYLWVRTYDDCVYRFDKQTESFTLVSGERADDIKLLKNGNVWILLENGGALRITTDKKFAIHIEDFFKKHNNLRGQKINEIFYSANNIEWLLTDNGIISIDCSTEQVREYLVNGKSFYSVFEDEKYFIAGASQGNLWISEKNKTEFSLVEFDSKSEIIAIKSLSTNEYIVATRRDGFFVYNHNTKEKTHYNVNEFGTNYIRDIYVDKHGEVWINQQVEACIAHFNPHTRKLKYEKIEIEEISVSSSQPPFRIIEDINGNLWVHPFGGGFSYFDRNKNSLQAFYNKAGNADWRFSNKVHSLASDGQGNLWMCTHSKGLEKITFGKKVFTYHCPEEANYESTTNSIRSVFVEKDSDRFWLNSRDGSTRIYDLKNNVLLGYLNKDGSISKTHVKNADLVYHMIKDKRGRLWLASKGNGLIKIDVADDGKFHLSRYEHNPENIYSISHNSVYYVYEDKNGRIWAATFGGGINYIDEKPNGDIDFINHNNKLKSWPNENCYRARVINEDKNNNIWIGTTSGIVRFNSNFDNPEDIKFHHYHRSQGDSCITDNDVYWITNTSENQLFFATFGGGLNKLISLDENGNAKFKTYTISDGLLSNILLAMQEDNNKNLWISSEDGLSKFDLRTESIDVYDNSFFKFKAGFNEAACAKSSDGLLFFGSSDGLYYFNPDSVHKNSFVPTIVLSKLRVLQRDVEPAEEKSILKQNLDNTKKIELSHKQNMFSIQYAALDMNAPERVRYAYKLDGFDREWNYVGNLRNAGYTNVPKGEYTFRVKSTNSDGVWVNNERQLTVIVKPSFWETPFAYILYAVSALLLMFVISYIFFIFYRLKHSVQVEKEVSDLKLRFFTNISHELRTPLTLIAGPVEQVLQSPELAETSREQLNVVKRNSDRMLHLVNQILDFRKVQNKKMKVQIQKIEVVSFTRRVMDNFNLIAVEHQIDYIFEPEKPEFYLWADKNKLEIIIFNLLSNAFKYTPQGKMISVFVAEDERTISIGVQDQGLGISESEKASLFVRFENLIEKNIFSKSSSSGIGLSLVNEFAEMHHATIDVESTPGKGSLFAVNFLKGREHYDEDVEFILNDYHFEGEDNIETIDEEIVDDDKKLMLLVEDNAELRSFLRSIFASKFKIIEARDGNEGLTKAMRFVPDFIICDVMMPEKDGFEVTKELRANLDTCHIPIILLTAKSSDDDKIAGLAVGADSYITKPFSSTYLQARVDIVLEQRKTQQEFYRRNMSVVPQELQAEANADIAESESQAEMSPNDKKFMDKLMELMELNIDNGELMVEELARELAVSRSVFFKKLKTLTGLAPIEFIREIRIKRAATLIETGDYTMTEIADMVGINDSRYFSKCFKNQFGMTPTEYREKTKNKNKH